MSVRSVHVDRYITPLREGGSLPAIVEANDLGLYVLKFRGAGQGKKVLISELLAGEIGRAAGLPIPELVFAELEADLARSEPDREVQSLIRASAGLNIAMDYLPGSVTFDPIAQTADSALASKIVWFDSFIMNVDRTVRNTNMLLWHKKLWLIDHGAALVFHFNWPSASEKTASAFPLIKDHVLLKSSGDLEKVDSEMKSKITEAELTRIVKLIPDEWLEGESTFSSVEEHRAAYLKFFTQRLAASKNFTQEALRARTAHV
ncbi:aminotransferase class I and II [bacterium]|nr:aminotransferase class I and II [bacterium]